jgi:hypothetical protein
MAHWLEIWTRPGDPNFGRLIDDPPFARASIHAGVNILGDGTMDLPNTFDRFDEILYIDRNTPANSISSLVRLFSDTAADPSIPVHEWIPSALVPTADKDDPDVNASGKDINIILTYPRTEPYDWDGSAGFACTACDWIWGGRNLLNDWDFENPQITPTVYELVVTATGGSYTIGASSGTSPTSAIAFNAGAAIIEAEIESDLSAFPDVLVADATSTNPFRRLIQYVTPPFGPTLVVNTGSLTGGSATLTVTQQGGMQPSGWQRAGAVLTGLGPVGNYTTWETSDDENHTPGGQFSLKIDPGPTGATSNRNGGAQQVLSVTPGQTYQASVWIYPTSATDRFRLQISTLGEEVVATSGGNGQTLTANTWNQISVPDVVIPTGVSQVIFRVQNTSPFPADPSVFYVDDAEFNEGLNAATPGEVIRLLYESYVDPVLQGTIYWDDGSATDTPYLTLDFSDTLDSAGAAWDESDVEIRVFQRMNLHQILSQLAGSYGVEFRVVPDDVENGTWLLQMYNDGGMMTDYTAAASPAILGASEDTRRQLRRFLPFSAHAVEGEGRTTGRAENAGFISALGKIGGERIDKTVPGVDAAVIAATEDRDDALLTGESWDYEFTDPQIVPLTDYTLGDLLTVHDPPEVDGVGRVWDITAVFSPERERWEVEYLVEESSA